jgi:predicted AAA+ superfamily ATPase
VTRYRTRLADSTVEELLREVPALLLVGPRATGKTTTAARFARTVIRLDREAEASAFRADPDVALRGLAEPVLLDEWQIVPSVLGAVKRAVDVDSRPGRFLLTGSVRADLEADTWPGTGRIVRVPLATLTVAERLQTGSRPLLDRLVAREPLVPAREMIDLRGYVRLALVSGFPEAAFNANDRARQRWLESYVEQLLTRDAESLEHGRDPVRLRKYFEALALNTAGIVEDKTLYDAAGITRKTASAYERLLSNLLVIDTLPAWTSNRLKRLTLGPKRYVVDAGLVGGVLGVDADAVLREGDLFGRVLDTFVAAHLRAEAAFTDCRPRLYHLRTEQGRHEVDLLAEIGAGHVIGIEVKATSAPKAASAEHLAWLRDELGARFLAGVVLHTGPRTFDLGERIVAAPISTLWAGE